MPMRVLAAALAVLLAACAGGGNPSGRLQVVATTYPLAWLAQEVLPAADVTLLADAGQDAHDVDLSPQQRARLDSADLVVYLGDIGFQPQLEEAIASLDTPVVSAVDAITRPKLLTTDDGAVDPHVWFDARLLAPVAEAIADSAGGQPERSREVAAQLHDLAAEVGDVLADCRFDDVVVSHEAYAYLLEPHGLMQHGVSHAGGHEEASPQRLAELVELVRERGLPAVLTEPVEGRTDAEAVAREAGVDLVEIYSLDIVDAEQADRAFPELLVEQAHAVGRAAGCTDG